ncbi:hypothetical protein CN090_02075 [Sinorhizobium meliloti]|uniref:hypothetical protein n=1 Tax=Rhizobium meliloti TaxID=382 RepID=UPI0002F4D935|nr:hypothetical protein [Sinorhizobium meliloti]ARS68197.1 hypothetical protein SMRU11_13515 [Sinorhizobium meliloti RU11/001]MDE3786668.1 hypothetical protein [Sinorhizobium meliloti]MDE3795270.1 hypothetical protein [Sinorhizobium meliloti]MDE4599253.1 hypothetical protein [Sinorhizobium meliloti]RVG99028.1 hypothetical protein CN218_01335 [Sinorhizobium meliloti]
MAGKQESMPDRTGLAPGGAEPDDHVADAGDAGSGAPYLGKADRARPDPPQPQPRNFSAGDGKVATHTPAPAEAGIEANDATGGEYWNHVLGDNTSAGTLRFLAAVGLFVLIAAALFWLVG